MKGKLSLTIVILAALAGGAYVYITRPVAAPSAPLEEPRVVPEEPADENQTWYRIDPSSSRVTFWIDEVLRGEPFEVVGNTNQVSGDILLDVGTPSNTRVEEVRINARTLATDSRQRDGAISRLILKSEDPANEFIVFKPGTFEDLPKTIEPGHAFGFTVTGDLTMAGVTKTTTFHGSATLDEQGRLVGNAGSVVARADFGLVIPNVPFVANVEENVELRIEFTALKRP